MQQKRFIVLFVVLISSCVYCQLDHNYAEEEINTKQLTAPTSTSFGKHWRHQIVGDQSKLSKINNETTSTFANAEETSTDVEKSASRKGKCTVVISSTKRIKTENVHTSTNY